MRVFFASLTEGSAPFIKGMEDEGARADLIKEDNSLSDRFIFSCSDDTLLVTPLLVNPDFKSDVEKILNLRNVTNLSPKNPTVSICRDVMEDKELMKKIVDLIREKNTQGESVEIFAYCNTPEFGSLLNEFRERNLQFEAPEAPEKEFYWTTSFLDSKGGFRQIVQMISGWEKSVKMPWGIICAKPTEARKIGLVLFSQGKGFVVKTNWGQSGEGLIIVRRNNGYQDYREVSEMLKQEFEKEDYWKRDLIVIEEYIDPNKEIGGGAPNVEGFIEKNGEVKLLYSCGMRVTREGHFRGVEIGSEVFNEETERKVRRIAKEIGEEFSEFGYRGFFEVDMQAGLDGEIYCLEANMRRTGGTHVFEGMKRLFGNGCFDKKYFVSNNWLEYASLQNLDYLKLKEKLKSIWFPMGGEKIGFLPTIINALFTGHLGYIIIGDSKKQAEEIEGKLKELLDNAT